MITIVVTIKFNILNLASPYGINLIIFFNRSHKAVYMNENAQRCRDVLKTGLLCDARIPPACPQLNEGLDQCTLKLRIKYLCIKGDILSTMQWTEIDTSMGQCCQLN